MRMYETIIIVQPDLGDEELKGLSAKVKEIISAMKGEFKRLEDWGVRKLAYPINKVIRGRYYYLRFDGDAPLIAELESRLRLDDKVVRYQSIKIEKDTGAAAAAAKAAEAEAAEEDRSSCRGCRGSRPKRLLRRIGIDELTREHPREAPGGPGRRGRFSAESMPLLRRQAGNHRLQGSPHPSLFHQRAWQNHPAPNFRQLLQAPEGDHRSDKKSQEHRSASRSPART